jgi:hypothetical protein
VYSTPFSTGTLGAILGGWQISGIFRTLSGAPLTLSSGADTGFIGRQGRPDQVHPDPYHPQKSRDQWFNLAAFVRPAPGSVGNMGRGVPRGPGSIKMDIALSRTFQVTENQRLQFRAEAFNVPNLTNLDNPVVNLNSPTFGRILSAQDPRILQFAVKYQY